MERKTGRRRDDFDEFFLAASSAGRVHHRLSIYVPRRDRLRTRGPSSGALAPFKPFGLQLIVEKTDDYRRVLRAPQIALPN